MIFDLDQRTVTLGVGELADFSLGPREAVGGSAGLWRAQLGTHWHNELRQRAVAEHAHLAEFELPISGRLIHRGWTFALSGRVDQVIRSAETATLREIKTVTRPLPADEVELRADYPGYFIQLAAYRALAQPATLAPGRLRELLVGQESTVGGAEALPIEREKTANPIAKTNGTERAAPTLRTELVFVEVGSGLAQTVVFTPAEDGLLRAQLERVAEFLDLRRRARERLRGLRYRPAFASPRPGQESTQAELTALFERRPLVLFEAPTGFGKTGVLLEFALGQLRSGHFDRALYLTSKSTGQLQVVRTLLDMTSPLGGKDADAEIVTNASRPFAAPTASDATGRASAPAVAHWHVRNKGEHCVNHTFHCVREHCTYLAGAAERWPRSGLGRFYLDEKHARDLETLRRAGRDAQICPYEITRAALAFNDVWVGDYNYVFAPRNRGLFFEQPGFVAARTLLILDEAHNLPSRVADAYSHGFTAADAFAVREELNQLRAASVLTTAWDHWCHALHALRRSDALSVAEEDDLRHLLGEVAKHVASAAVDFAALSPRTAETLWAIPALLDDLQSAELPRLWWCPRDGELALTCLDAAPAIGATVREFGGAVLASATLSPVENFAAACGLGDDRATVTAGGRNPRREPDPAPPPSAGANEPPEPLGALNKRETRRLYRQLTSAAELLRVEEAHAAASPAVQQAHTPWRDQAYDLAIDTRVDTTFQHRSQHYTTTAATLAAVRAAARDPVAVFFPSYAYAEAIAKEVGPNQPQVRVALQPRLRDLAAQTKWVEESLREADALFLVLGSSFAEGIDALGGRITHALVVGPALPEVNAVQRARLAELTRQGVGREEAFRRVYQIPGMTKVNQALGRLVRAPGQHARVLLHCRRFLESSYFSLLAREYQSGTQLGRDEALGEWLAER